MKRVMLTSLSAIARMRFLASSTLALRPTICMTKIVRRSQTYFITKQSYLDMSFGCDLLLLPFSIGILIVIVIGEVNRNVQGIPDLVHPGTTSTDNTTNIITADIEFDSLK
jgi:hypothetical protein